jgi:opacity protein-like surface antigen
MIRKGWIAAMLGATAMVVSSGALAQRGGAADTGWYVSGSIGQSDDLDDAMAWKISGGYQINRNLSVEVGYASLGELDAGFGVNVEASAIEVIGMYKFPLQNRFSIYGLAGLARIEAESSAGSVFGFPIPAESDSSTELTFGFGVQYDFSPKLGVRAQWQDYVNTSVISAGIVYKF